MLGQMKLSHKWLVISLALATVIACASHHEGSQNPVLQSLSAADNEPPCGELIENFEQYLAVSKSCTTAADCDFFEVSPAGCWTLFNKNRRESLNELQKQVMVPRCRIFLPQYKCAAKPEGSPACEKSRCTWGKGE